MRLRELLSSLADKRQADFVGLGIILYSATEGLPIIPLGSLTDIHARLPVSEASELESVLMRLSSRRSPCHDGFHLIEASSGRLTHIAQFVSPPLTGLREVASAIRPSGARQMTALLISTVPQVASAAVLAADGGVHVYVDGVMVRSS